MPRSHVSDLVSALGPLVVLGWVLVVVYALGALVVVLAAVVGAGSTDRDRMWQTTPRVLRLPALLAWECHDALRDGLDARARPGAPLGPVVERIP